MPARIRKGDLVAVISGADRGKRGKVLRVIPETDRVVVEGVNLITKHLRKSQQNPQGGRVRREAALPACRVLPVDPQTDRPTRVKTAVHEGRTVRVGVRSGVRIDHAPATKRDKAARKAAAGEAPEAASSGKAKE